MKQEMFERIHGSVCESVCTCTCVTGPQIDDGSESRGTLLPSVLWTPWGAAQSCPWSPTDHSYTFTAVEHVGNRAWADTGAVKYFPAWPTMAWAWWQEWAGLGVPCSWCEERPAKDMGCVAGGPVGLSPPREIPARGDEDNWEPGRIHPFLKMPR